MIMASPKKNSEIEVLKNEIEKKDSLIEELTREKASLLKIISHDIRSPFNRMFALLQLLELEFKEITPDQKKYIDQMYRSVFGGMEMVDGTAVVNQVNCLGCGRCERECPNDAISIAIDDYRGFDKMIARTESCVDVT